MIDSENSQATAWLGGTLLGHDCPDADAVLTSGSRILAVDRSEVIEELAPPPANRIRLDGRYLSPGFHDAHYHFFQSGLVSRRAHVGGARSLAEALERFRAHYAHENADVQFAEGFDETVWNEGSAISRAALDRISDATPIVWRRVCGHLAVFNTAALRELERRRPDHNVNEQGVAVEGVALEVDEVFPPNLEETTRAMNAAAEQCFRDGVTTCGDFLRPGLLPCYEAFLNMESMPIRLHTYSLPDAWSKARTLREIANDRGMTIRGWKLFLDGSIGSRSAAVGADYRDRPGHRGALEISPESVRRFVESAECEELAVAIHAIGDRAISVALDAFEGPRERNLELGHRLEHVEMPRAVDVDRLRTQGIRPCVQPNFVGQWGLPGGLYEAALGEGRTSRMNPFRSLRNNETGVFFGSDGMPPGPSFGIRSAMEHPNSSERLSLEEAHALYTRASSWLEDDELAGRLVPGAPADLVVLPKDAFDPKPHPTVADVTLIGGRVVFENGTLEGVASNC